MIEKRKILPGKVLFFSTCFSITDSMGKDIRRAMKKAAVWVELKEDNMAHYMEPKLDLR